jgi:antitoxin component YwqK of YwqJK toxin-antitoxin module
LRYEWYFKLPLDGTRADGISRGWWSNGKLKQIKTWKNGKQVGISTGWYENGQKWYEQTYKDDKKMDYILSMKMDRSYGKEFGRITS